MSIKVMSRIWEKSKAKGSGLIVLLAISDNANDEGVAWPSIKTIARKSRMSERNVQYAIQKLVEIGELEVNDQAARHGTNEYTVTVGVQTLHRGGESPCTGGVKALAPGGVQPVAPEPSLRTVIEPKPSTGAKRREREIDPAQKELTQHFSELTHLPVPEPKTGKDWAAAQELWFRPIARIYGMANGRGRDLVRQSVDKMRADHLTISSPKSIEKVALSIFGENFRRYQPKSGSDGEYDPMAALNNYLLEQEK